MRSDFIRKVAPIPEMICPGNWKKTDTKGTEGSVSMVENVIRVPWDESPCSRAIRAHEYLHLKWSPQIPPNDITKAMRHAIGAFEDARVNYLGSEKQGVDLKPIGDMLTENYKEKVLSLPPFIQACTYVAMQGYNDPNGTGKALWKELHEFGVAEDVDSFIEELHTYPTFNKVEELAGFLCEIITDPSGEGEGEGDGEASGEGSGPSGAISAEKTTAEMEAELESAMDEAADAFNAGSTKVSSNPTDFVAKVKVSALIDEDRREVKPGNMIIVRNRPEAYHRVPRAKLGTSNKPSDFGDVFRYPERVMSDGMVFSSRKKSSVGTIMIDISGSMNVDMDDIHKIIRATGGVTIATYCGKTSGENRGWLDVIAKGQRVVKEIEERAYGNVIDYPALKWLARQEGPRIWICDGEVTGIGDSQDANYVKVCFDTAKRARIKIIGSLEEFMRIYKIT